MEDSERYKRITVRLNPQDFEALSQKAKEKNQDEAVYIRELVQAHLLLDDLDEKIDARLEGIISSGKLDEAIFTAYLRKLANK
jgi:hypothetical protein